MQARLAILKAFTTEAGSAQIKKLLLDAVRLYAEACPSERGRGRIPRDGASAAGFTRESGWEQSLRAVGSAWRAQNGDAETPDWDDPAILMVGDTLNYLLNGGRLPVAGTPVETWVLLEASRKVTPYGEETIPEGLLARLVVEKVPGGSGLLYPDCRYSGYLPLDESFQAGLRT